MIDAVARAIFQIPEGEAISRPSRMAAERVLALFKAPPAIVKLKVAAMSAARDMDERFLSGDDLIDAVKAVENAGIEPDFTCPGIDAAIALTDDRKLRIALEGVRYDNANMRYSLWHVRAQADEDLDVLIRVLSDVTALAEDLDHQNWIDRGTSDFVPDPIITAARAQVGRLLGDTPDAPNPTTPAR